MSDKYAAITAHWGQYPVQLMCRALEVSLSGYYEAKARLAHGPSARARADEQLLVHVRAAFAKSQRRYGAPRCRRTPKFPHRCTGKFPQPPLTGPPEAAPFVTGL